MDEEKNRISWRSKFGDGHAQGPEKMSELHDAYYQKVGAKWGFERGDSKEETKAKHRSTEEYRRELIHTVTDLSERRQTIMTCSILLFLGYLDKATMYAESHGGGGGRTTGWGRTKDDDDDRWWLKCISKAAQMTSPAGRRKGMRR